MTSRPARRQAAATHPEENGIDLLEKVRLPLRAGLAAGLAAAVGIALGVAHPVYALVSAVVVTDLQPAETRKLAGPRLLGTALGGLVGCLATLVLPPGAMAAAIAAALAVATTMFLCAVLGQAGASKVASYVAGIIILSFAGDPWRHAVDRLLETLLGIFAATLVSLVPIRYKPPPKGEET